MPEPTIHDILTKTFSNSGKNEWLRAASAEFPSSVSLQDLAWNINGVKCSPYYTDEDLAETEYLKKFHHASHHLTLHGWLNLPEISVISEMAANEEALEFLLMGADGIVFDVSNSKDFDIEILLKRIDWNHCSISFAGADTDIVTKIFAYAQRKKYNPAHLSGCIWWKQLPPMNDLFGSANKFVGEFLSFKLLGIQVSKSSPVHEISETLEQGVKWMDKMTDLRLERTNLFRAISISHTCDENFFVNIAKIKAIRMLWYQVSQAFEIGYRPSDLHIHCRAEKQTDEKYDPHGQMLKNTTAAASAIAGGCNSITVNPGDRANSMTHRVALNVSNILKEESHFDKVTDPLAGSYAIEKIVHELSQAAWNDFQKKLQT